MPRFIPKHPGWLVFIVSLLAIASGCAALERTSADSRSGLSRETIDVDGTERSYYLHLPPGHESKRKLPLVLVLHGGGRGDGLGTARHLGFTSLADRDRFIVAYPNGIDDYWRDGRVYTHRGVSDTRVDDVSFIARLIGHLIREHRADPARVYVTGISNGGMMTLRLGCEIGSKLAAIAAIAANMPTKVIESCRPGVPLPVLLINGTDDPMVPYHGGYVHFGRKRMGAVASTRDSIGFFAKHNGCDPVPVVEALPDRDPGDYTTVTATRFVNANGACAVVLYTVHGGGHTLPGSDVPDMPRLLGRKNNDIDGAQMIWDFFSRQSR